MKGGEAQCTEIYIGVAQVVGGIGKTKMKEEGVPYRTLRCEWMMRLASSGVRSSMLGLSRCSAMAANRGAGGGNDSQQLAQSSPKPQLIESSPVRSSRAGLDRDG